MLVFWWWMAINQQNSQLGTKKTNRSQMPNKVNYGCLWQKDAASWAEVCVFCVKGSVLDRVLVNDENKTIENKHATTTTITTTTQYSAFTCSLESAVPSMFTTVAGTTTSLHRLHTTVPLSLHKDKLIFFSTANEANGAHEGGDKVK